MMSAGDIPPSPPGSLYNTIVVSTAFMLIFSGYRAAIMTMPITVESFKQENRSYTPDVFVGLAILYATTSASGWIAPSVLRVLHYKCSMAITSVTYVIFILILIYPVTWAFYAAMVLNGVANAIMWAANGACITINSTSKTMSRNSGIFMTMYSSSMIIGNIIVSQVFQGVDKIDQQTRITLYIILGSVTATGGATLLLLRPAAISSADISSSVDRLSSADRLPSALNSSAATRTLLSTTLSPPDKDVSRSRHSKCEKLTHAFISAAKLIRTPQMAALLIPFLLPGMVMSFYTGVYSACIGFTNQFGPAVNSLVGQVGIATGMGKALSGMGVTVLRTRLARDTLSVLAFMLHVVPFYLIYLNIPSDAPLGPTQSESYMAPDRNLALVCGFVLGVGDTIINVVVYSVIETFYRAEAGEAHSIFRFACALGSMIGFLMAGQLFLHWQLLIMSVLCMASVGVLCSIEWKHRKDSHLKEMTSNDPTITAKFSEKSEIL